MWFDDPYEEQEFAQERYEYDESDENEKLRELLAELYEDQCDECDRWKYRDRLHEVGVEVD